VKALALLCALANLLAVGFVGWLMWFAALFPWENQDPAEAGADDWLVPAAVVLVGAAGVLLLAAILSRLWVAAIAITVQTAVALAVLDFALEASDHSDGKLLGLFAGVELVAICSGIFLRARVIDSDLPAHMPSSR
jgi:hypothetical protein